MIGGELGRMCSLQAPNPQVGFSNVSDEAAPCHFLARATPSTRNLNTCGYLGDAMGNGKMILAVESDINAACMPILVFPTAWHGAVATCGQLHCSSYLRGSGWGKTLEYI